MTRSLPISIEESTVSHVPQYSFLASALSVSSVEIKIKPQNKKSDGAAMDNTRHSVAAALVSTGGQSDVHPMTNPVRTLNHVRRSVTLQSPRAEHTPARYRLHACATTPSTAETAVTARMALAVRGSVARFEGGLRWAGDGGIRAHQGGMWRTKGQSHTYTHTSTRVGASARTHVYKHTSMRTQGSKQHD